MVALGVWEGGTILCFEAFQPDKHVAIDVFDRADSSLFKSYIAERRVADRLKTLGYTPGGSRHDPQHSAPRVLAEPIDVVIDDASHLYEPTRASFETLFPLLRPGGLYLIEDWQWSYYTDFQPPAVGGEGASIALGARGT